MEINPYTSPQAPLATGDDAPARPALWNPMIVGLCSLLLTPVFGSVLLLKNWEAIGNEQQVRIARGWLVLSLASLVAQLFFWWWFIPFLIVWGLGFQAKQMTYVMEHWGDEYPRRGWGVPLLLGALGLMVVLIVYSWVALLRNGNDSVMSSF
jgi:hypothetical protein